MKPMWILTALIMLAATVRPAGADAPTATLTVEASNFRNSKGRAAILLFRSADGFPEEGNRAFGRVWTEIRDGRARATFPGLPPGRYAVVVLHDENQNQKIDKNRLGFPTEGYAVSNNARRRFSAPRFGEAAFPLTGERRLQLTVEY